METAVAAVEPALDRNRLTRLFAATFCHFISMGMYMAAVPLFVHFELGASRALVGLAVGSFFPGAILMRPIIGNGLDSWGRRPFVLLATGIASLTSLLFFFADTVWFVIVLGLLRGFVGAAFYTGAATIATDLGPRPRRAEVIALFSLFLYGGFAIGPGIGEWIAENLGFNVVWISAAAISGLAFLFATGLPETLELTDEVEPPGGRFGLHRAGLAPGLVLLGAAAGYTSITGFAPLYAREIGLATSGGLYATFSLTILGFRVLTRKLADRHARLKIALPGLALNTLGLTTLAVFRHPAAAYVSVAIFGIGFALLFPALMAFTADRVPESQRGSAMTTFTMFFDFGAVIGTYVVGVLAENLGFGAGFALPAAMCALATAGIAARVLFGFGRQANTR